MPNGHLLQVNDDSFDKLVVNSDLPVLVAFGAPFCDTCISVDRLQDIAKDRLDVLFAYMDVEANSGTPRKYQFHGIPRVMLFAGKGASEPLAVEIGEMKWGDIAAFIDANLPATIPSP
ncbi:MAG: thioredoxin family protein [Burkholderiales bacterium]